jgi:hypothetical protein
MKKIISICLIFLGLLWFAMLINSCTQVKYVMIDAKDSTKLIEVRKRIIYQDVYQHSMMPTYFYNNTYPIPYYMPIVIPRIEYRQNPPRPQRK